MAPILIAPDGFKGTFTATDVARALAQGVRAAGDQAIELPTGDGGEGTMDALLDALGGRLETVGVNDPLGRLVRARYALLDDRRAVVEMAEASGLERIAAAERDAWAASTRGTGELIAAAARAGARTVIVTVGGSATTDGGAGALEALADAKVEPDLRVVCDVRTPWEDAARVFGPQKGADEDTIRRLEARLDDLAIRAPRDPRGVPMTGCAGGLSGGLWAHRGATLLPGAAFVLDTIGFDAHLAAARFAITGEGQLDAQTLTGKAVAEVATRCRQAGVPCHAVVGRDELDAFEARVLDLASVTEATTLDELERAGRALASA